MTSNTDYVHEGNNLVINISTVAHILILHDITDIAIYTASSVQVCLMCKYLIRNKVLTLALHLLTGYVMYPGMEFSGTILSGTE